MKTAEQIIKIIKEEEKFLWTLVKKATEENRTELKEKYRHQHSAILNLMDELEINTIR